jgi:hypothetical protein
MKPSSTWYILLFIAATTFIAGYLSGRNNRPATVSPSYHRTQMLLAREHGMLLMNKAAYTWAQRTGVRFDFRETDRLYDSLFIDYLKGEYINSAR